MYIIHLAFYKRTHSHLLGHAYFRERNTKHLRDSGHHSKLTPLLGAKKQHRDSLQKGDCESQVMNVDV